LPIGFLGIWEKSPNKTSSRPASRTFIARHLRHERKSERGWISTLLS
jgi:hypothetical protein